MFLVLRGSKLDTVLLASGEQRGTIIPLDLLAPESSTNVGQDVVRLHCFRSSLLTYMQPVNPKNSRSFSTELLPNHATHNMECCIGLFHPRRRTLPLDCWSWVPCHTLPQHIVNSHSVLDDLQTWWCHPRLSKRYWNIISPTIKSHCKCLHVRLRTVDEDTLTILFRTDPLFPQQSRSLKRICWKDKPKLCLRHQRGADV